MTPLFEQHKHMQAQQMDTIRYLNELNPWLERLATTTEKAEDVPQDVQRIARALGVERRADDNSKSDEEAKTVIEELLGKLDDIRTSVDRSKADATMPGTSDNCWYF